MIQRPTSLIPRGNTPGMGCHQVSLLSLLAVAAWFFTGLAHAKSPAPPRLGNRHIQISFDGQLGSLVQIRDLATAHKHLSNPGATPRSLWGFKAQAGEKTINIFALEAQTFRWEKDGGKPDALRLIWEDFQKPEAPDLVVTATVELEPDQPMSVWSFVAENLGSLSIREIRYPIVSGIAPQEDERLALPIWMGEEVSNPRKTLAGSAGKEFRRQWNYPGLLSLQCLAYYRENGPGFYAACNDTTFQRKSFALRGDADSRVHFESVHQCETAGKKKDNYQLGYQVILGTFRGDWLTAAERYRAWGVRQEWARSSRLHSGKVPDWVRQTALWVWNRGRSPGVLPPAAAIQKKLGLPVSVFWHWWHGCPYDTGFPEYFPPRDGTDSFRSALDRAHREGIHAMVYMNQRLWGMTTQSWKAKNAAAFAVKQPDGSVRPEVYNIFTKQPCASMCMGTEFWRNHYASLSEKAVLELGVDAIYMDQACSSLACYDPTHGHSLGGGAYWTEGFRTLARDIRQRCGEAHVPALAGEGCGEAWLQHLDLMLTLQVSRERYAGIKSNSKVIPMFHAVYHPYTILYGNYGSLTIPPYDDLWPEEFAPPKPLALLDRKFSGQFYLEQARALAWGQQPTIANFRESQIKERPEEIDYVLRAARMRNSAAKYLVRGTFLRPPSLNTPEVELDFSRLSIYTGQKDRVQSFRKTTPAVITGAWLAPDGDSGIVLASIVDRPLDLSILLNQSDQRLAPHSRIYRIENGKRSFLGTYEPENPSLNLQFPPLGICLIEITAKNSPPSP